MPKLVFEKMRIEDNIDFVKECFYDSSEVVGVHTYTVQLFPELASLDATIQNSETDKKIEEVVTDYYSNYNKFDDDVKRYSKVWSKYNNSFFDALTKYLNCSWPEEHSIIPAYVGIIPVCPRYLDNFSFSVHDDITDSQLIETCAHELCHFLWFKKWKDLYPEIKEEDYDNSSLIWEYSEMVVEPILNCKEISKVFNNKKTRYCYDSFYENDSQFMDDLMDIYNSDISIEKKIITGYERLKKYKYIKSKKVPK